MDRSLKVKIKDNLKRIGVGKVRLNYLKIYLHFTYKYWARSNQPTRNMHTLLILQSINRKFYLMKFRENIENKEQQIFDWVLRLGELGENIRAPQLSKIKIITVKPI